MNLHEKIAVQRCLIVLLFMGILPPGQTQRRFITVFMENFHVSSATKYQLYLVTYDKPATVTVNVAQPRFNQTLPMESNSSAIVTLDYTYMITEKQVTSKAVLVESDVDISVFGFYTHFGTADAMSCLPVEDLGQEYYISITDVGTEKQFAVANGLEDNALINVTTSVSITFNGVQYSKGETFSFTLGHQEAFQFQSPYDLTGTRISSTVPVAVFSGQKCMTGINNACDTLVEQLYPVSRWGRHFALFPLMNHTQDSISIITSSPDTLVNIDSVGDDKQYNFSSAGSFVRIPLRKILIVNSSKPIMVNYLFQESKPGVVPVYDPFLVNVPPFLTVRSYYKFITQKTYFNYLLIVTQATSADGFYLDSNPLRLYSYSQQYFNGFRALEVFLDKSDGQHEIYHDLMPFTIYVYGVENYVSYGYSMGHETIYPGAALPAPTEGYNPEGTLTCLSNGAEYQLPLSMVQEADLNVADIHLRDPLCRAVPEEYSALIQIPFTACGSRAVSEGDRTYYENVIYGTVPGAGIHRIEIPVRCEMEGNKTLGLNLRPKVTDVVSLGHYNVSLKLYKTEAFSDLITTYPYEADIHGHLHVEFKVESDDQNLQILVENCKASPTLENTQQIYNFIKQGCPQDSTLQTHPVPDQRVQHFSLHVFKFSSFEEVYLSCNVIICHNGTSPNRCTQGCLSTRHRRNVHTSPLLLSAARLSQGPIVFKSAGLQTSQAVPSFVLVAVIAVMALLSVLSLVIQKRFYKSRKYTLLQNADD